MDAIFIGMSEMLNLALMDSSYIPWIFGGGLLWGIISYFVGERNGNGCLGCVLGLFLGPIGILITALMGRGRNY